MLFATSWAKPMEKRFDAVDELDVPAPIVALKEKILEKRQTAPFAVTGVTGGGVQPRLEIRQLMNDTDQFNIYVLAQQLMQETDQSDFLSFYSIAGIHGRREVLAWDGVEGNDNSPNVGYCTHVSNIFLTWHRPYLALYEQLLQSYAMQVAQEFPAGDLQNRMVAAASTLRIPYWDWAMNPPSGQNTLPDSIAQPNITVTTPNGTESIANPLYSYYFHPVEGLYYQQYLQWPQTLRWPSSTNADAVTQVGVLTSSLNNAQQSWAQRIYNLFTMYNDFMDFSNEPFIKSPGPLQYDSIESVHDSIHTTVGGQNYGHMSVIDVSAFDPVFFMHHAMVDRCFAMWQALWPGTYVEEQSQYQSSYWYNQGDNLTETTPLKPFYSDGSGDFWDSDSVRDLTTFGYTYPELESGNVSDVRTAINTLYGSSATGSSSKRKRDGNSTTTQNLKQYVTNIQTQKNAMNSTYFIFFFLGAPNSDPDEWPRDPALAGTMGVVSMTDNSNMEPVVISGTVPLTAKLQQYANDGIIESMDDDVVTSYLKSDLQWTVRKVRAIPQSIPLINLADFIIGRWHRSRPQRRSRSCHLSNQHRNAARNLD